MRTTIWPAAACAVLVFVLALLSPVETVDSDPAISLLAAQALIDYGTLDLSVYLDEPECAYDLTANYRVKKWQDSYYYYSFGTPILSAPAVWVANGLGFHMLRQKDEFATQNLLSALACVLVFVLLYHLSRHYIEPLPSLLIAVVSTLGSSLMSTLATGLWNTDWALVFICLALVHLAAREDRRPAYSYLLLLLVLAFLCRPSSAFFAVAVVVSRLHYNRRAVLKASMTLALVVAIGLVLHRLAALEWIPRYYGERRLAPEFFFAGIHATLLSPSRGLLVFSPFLVAVLSASVVRFSSLRNSPMFRLALIWILLLLPAVALKLKWWTGHSYGPRSTTELIPALVLITALLWRGWTREGLPRSARLTAIVYLALAVPAIAIHSGQGLFNPAVRRWNEEPNIDLYPQALFDWRFPQFLATNDMIDERRLVLRPPLLTPYALGSSIAHDETGVSFARGWSVAEANLRWTRGRRAELVILIDQLDAGLAHAMDLHAGTLGRQSFRLSVNGSPIGAFELDGIPPRETSFHLAPGLLVHGENRIQFTILQPASTEADPRKLGLALRSLSLYPLSTGEAPL